MLAEQQELRNRKLGDMLVVRQIISHEELAAAIEQQTRMPLVRSGVLQGAIEHAYKKLGSMNAGLRTSDDPGPQSEFEPDDASKLLASMERVDARLDEDDVQAIEQSDNSLVRLINSMILDAHSQGVSDIHVE